MTLDTDEYLFGKIEASNDFYSLLGDLPVTSERLEQVTEEMYRYLDWIMKGNNDWVVERKLAYIYEFKNLVTLTKVKV
jgi:hypothetical protein